MAIVAIVPTVKADISGLNCKYVAMQYGIPNVKRNVAPFQNVFVTLNLLLIFYCLQAYLNRKLIIREINPAIT